MWGKSGELVGWARGDGLGESEGVAEPDRGRVGCLRRSRGAHPEVSLRSGLGAAGLGDPEKVLE